MIKRALRDIHRCDHSGHNVAVGRKSSLENHAAHFVAILAAAIKVAFTGAIILDKMWPWPARAAYVIAKQIFAIFTAAIKVAFTSAILQDTMLLLVARAVYEIMQHILLPFWQQQLR